MNKLTIYCAKPNFSKYFLTLDWRPFWKRAIQFTWCDTSHVSKAVKSVMFRPESNNFVLAVQLVPSGERKRKLFFHVPEMYKFYPSLSFLRETSQPHKWRLLADVTICLFFRRVSFLAETSLGMITNNTEQHIWHIHVPKLDFQWK